MDDEAKIKYHASTAHLHLQELIDLQPKTLSQASLNALQMSIAITDVLAEGELCQEKLV